MGFRPEELEQLRQKVRVGETKATGTLDVTTTTETITFKNPMEKVSYQASDAAFAATVTVSVNGTDFAAGVNLTAAAIISDSTHLIRAIRFVRTAGTGIVTVNGR